MRNNGKTAGETPDMIANAHNLRQAKNAAYDARFAAHRGDKQKAYEEATSLWLKYCTEERELLRHMVAIGVYKY